MKLVELGLNPDAGAIVRSPDLDVRMVPEYETQKRLKADITNLLGPEQGERLM